MPHFPDHPTLEIALYAAAGVILLFFGYRIGRAFGHLAASKLIERKEQELFTTQKGFKTLYEQEIAKLKEENAGHTQNVETLKARVEDYRKKAAGLGGLAYFFGHESTMAFIVVAWTILVLEAMAMIPFLVLAFRRYDPSTDTPA